MLNSYTLEVYEKANKPCYVVTILHTMRAGVFFFNSLIEAKEFIAEAKKELKKYAELVYNCEGVTNINAIKLIKTVLTDNNYIIGENGRTYYKNSVIITTKS